MHLGHLVVSHIFRWFSRSQQTSLVNNTTNKQPSLFAAPQPAAQNTGFGTFGNQQQSQPQAPSGGLFGGGAGSLFNTNQQSQQQQPNQQTGGCKHPLSSTCIRLLIGQQYLETPNLPKRMGYSATLVVCSGTQPSCQTPSSRDNLKMRFRTCSANQPLRTRRPAAVFLGILVYRDPIWATRLLDNNLRYLVLQIRPSNSQREQVISAACLENRQPASHSQTLHKWELADLEGRCLAIRSQQARLPRLRTFLVQRAH
jgi:hypothetical protein